MKFSMKSRYGLRALVDLAVHSQTEAVALNGIAERNHISQQYLEQVFAALKRAGLIKSHKGSQGGYYLARQADQITISDILLALEGDYRIDAEDISENSGSPEISRVIQTLIIDRVNREMSEIFHDVTLYDLVLKYRENLSYTQNMYYI